MDQPLLMIVALLAGLATFYVMNAYIAGRRYSRPARIRISFATPADYDLPYEEVTLRSADGVRLAGWYIPAQNGAAVILLHGYSGNRLAMMFHARTLAGGGFGVLMFDLRGHGDSGGSGTFARGENVIGDVRSALNYVRGRPEVESQRIGIMGVSVGGTVALQAAARISELAAVAADGAGPGAFEDLLPPRGLWGRLFLPVNRLFFSAAGRNTTTRPFAANKQVVRRIAPRPVLFIATGRGTERHLNERYYAAAAEPKQLWVLEEAGHASGWHKSPEEYGETLLNFFREHLLG